MEKKTQISFFDTVISFHLSVQLLFYINDIVFEIITYKYICIYKKYIYILQTKLKCSSYKNIQKYGNSNQYANNPKGMIVISRFKCMKPHINLDYYYFSIIKKPVLNSAFSLDYLS